MRWATCVIVASCVATSASLVHASEERTSVYEIHPAIDFSVLGLGLAAISAALIEVDPPSCLPSCEAPDNLNAIDRTALGRYSTSSLNVANALIVTFIAGPPVWSALGTRDASAFLEDAFVHGQTLALTQGLTQIMKFSVQKPAPL